MRSRLRHVFTLATLLAACLGCGESAEKVCDRVAKLSEQAGERGDNSDCIKKVAELKDKDPTKFKCLSQCTKEADNDSAKRCVSKCPDAASSASR